MNDLPPSPSSPRALSWLAAGLGCVVAFYEVAAFYDGFALPQTGIQTLPRTEVLFAAWYLALGSLALACIARALTHTALPQRLLMWARRVLRRPAALCAGCAALVFCGSLLFRQLILSGQAITDDELTYDFIAATLLQGRLVNTPPIDAELLRNQFVIATEHAWYGKYPIGHPVLLALGKAVGAQALIVPVIGALGVLLTFGIGRRVIGERWAAVGCVLLALSPQYVWTHGTQLSQPTSMLCLLLAMLAWLRLLETGRPVFAGLAGLAFGYGILTRPLPGCLFVIAALVTYALERGNGHAAATRGQRLRELALAASGASAGVGLVMLVNLVQSGSPWTSGYHAFHGELEILDTEGGIVSASVGGALLRQNFWLHGWPLSLALLPLARFRSGTVLVWSMLAAVLAYRVLVPKTVVATTGSTYTLEIVPLLCLASAAGIARAVTLLERVLGSAERAREASAAVLMAATIVGLALFVPGHVAAAHRSASARVSAYATLRNAGVERAVVFANLFVIGESGLSWALRPPNPSPALDDDLVFLRILPEDRGYERMMRAAKTRFPDRRAVLLLRRTRGFELYDLPLSPDAPRPPEFSWSKPR